ncbi:MAG: CopG family ribbon-helix-helix protein [Candidatus Methanofastidiosia archaeon]
MQKVTRFGVSVPTNLLKLFDEIIAEEKHRNRSKAIAALIRAKVSETEFTRGSYYLIGTITYLYNSSVTSVPTKIQDAILESKANVISNTHHIAKDGKVLGVFTCSGNWFDIKETFRTINSTKGVEFCKASFVNPKIEG